MIHVLSLSKKGDIPAEDVEKIEKLRIEREECLQPVKIRITGHDGGQLSNSNNQSTGSDSPGIMR